MDVPSGPPAVGVSSSPCPSASSAVSSSSPLWHGHCIVGLPCYVSGGSAASSSGSSPPASSASSGPGSCQPFASSPSTNRVAPYVMCASCRELFGSQSSAWPPAASCPPCCSSPAPSSSGPGAAPEASAGASAGALSASGGAPPCSVCTTFQCGERAVRFRPMVAADYSAVRSLLPHVSRCDRWHEELFLKEMLELPTYHAFCAETADAKRQLVAFAELHRMPHLGRRFDARLERVIVAPAFRSMGLATQLCRHILLVAKEKLQCGRVDLTVENPRARYIYENKLGFAEQQTSVMRIETENLDF
eukprot:GHVT01066354.1.p1 GENE.GHVT01066354.1~~GHVT01066354.1.p1  ORF type:complete len:304 (-),score=83.14 GHVT01066354.1:851-1762(-)